MIYKVVVCIPDVDDNGNDLSFAISTLIDLNNEEIIDMDLVIEACESKHGITIDTSGAEEPTFTEADFDIVDFDSKANMATKVSIASDVFLSIMNTLEAAK